MRFGTINSIIKYPFSKKYVFYLEMYSSGYKRSHSKCDRSARARGFDSHHLRLMIQADFFVFVPSKTTPDLLGLGVFNNFSARYFFCSNEVRWKNQKNSNLTNTTLSYVASTFIQNWKVSTWEKVKPKIFGKSTQ